MKKVAYFIFAVSLVMSFSTFVYAEDFELIGREISPGIDLGYKTVGALFIGKFFDGGFGSELGRFTVVLDHGGNNIEQCGLSTELLRFKLIMNFNSGARLVLLGPTEGDVFAYWGYNDPDPNCEDGNCPIIDADDYLYYFDLFRTDVEALSVCSSDNAYIAEVSEFDVKRQWLGSYRTPFNSGTVSGYLVHTPIISPAIFGSLTLNQ